jgi:hypothetical protein
MAAIKAIEQDSGAVASYWRIAASHIYHGQNSTLVEIEGYVDAKARISGKAPLVSHKQVSLTGTDMAIISAKGDVRSVLYALLCEQDESLKDAASDVK